MLTISIPILAWICFIIVGVLLSIFIGIKINKIGVLKVDTIEDLNNFASIVDPDATIKISGTHLKTLSQGVIQIMDDIKRCHHILSELGVPMLDQREDALIGVEIRLAHMLNKINKGSSNEWKENNS